MYTYPNLGASGIRFAAAIYVREDIKSNDHSWVEIKLKNGESLLCDCMYKSPTKEIQDIIESTTRVCNVTVEAVERIDCEYEFVQERTNIIKPFDTIQNCYLHQHVLAPTRTCTNTYLHQHVLAPTRTCTNTYLHQHALAPARTCTSTYLHQHVLAPARTCTNTYLHQHVLAPTRTFTNTYLHQHVLAPTRTCTNTYLHQHVLAPNTYLHQTRTCTKHVLAPNTYLHQTRTCTNTYLNQYISGKEMKQVYLISFSAMKKAWFIASRKTLD